MALGGFDLLEDLRRLIAVVPMIESQRDVVVRASAEIERLRDIVKNGNKAQAAAANTGWMQEGSAAQASGFAPG